MADFTDNFNRAQDSAIGNGWTNGPSASFFIDASRAYDLSGGTGRYCYRTGAADMDVSVKIRHTNGVSAVPPGGIVLRNDGSGNFIVARYQASSNQVSLMRWAGGAYTADIGSAVGSVTINTDSVIRATAEGTTYKIYVDGVLKKTETYSNATYDSNTGYGMYSESGSLRFDDLEYTAIASAVMVIDRASVLTGSGTVVVNLTGTNTAWTGSTVFTLTGGLAGWSKASQNVTSATTATVTLNKGSGTGTLTLTESVTGTTSDTLAATNTATSVGAGAWTTAATWDVLEVPAAGNHASTGHNVTVSGSQQITNLTITAGTLTIQNGATLRRTGATTWSGGTLQVGEATGGGTLNIDGGTTWPVGTGASQSCKLVTRGTFAQRAAIQTTPGTTGSGNAYFTNNGLDSQEIDLEYFKFVNIGTTTTPAFIVESNTAAKTHRAYRGVFDANSGDLKFGSTLPANVGYDIQEVTFRNHSTSAFGLYVQGGQIPSGGVTRRVSGCIFLSQPRFAAASQTTDDNYFMREGFVATGQLTTAGVFASCKRNFLRGKFLSSHPRWGHWGTSPDVSVDDCITDGNVQIAEDATLQADGTYTPVANYTNPHWNTPNNGLVGGLWGLWGSVFESFRAEGTDSFGDIDYTPIEVGGVVYDSDTRFNLVVPDHGTAMDMSDLRNPGCMTTHNGDSGVSLSSVYEHNTVFHGQQGFAAILEGPGAGPPYGAAGQIDRLRSNLGWNTAGFSSGTLNYITYFTQSVLPTDVVIDYITTCSHNWGWNVRTDGTHGMHRLRFTTSPANEQTGDPQFYDDTRHFAKWVQTLQPSWSGVPTPTIDQYRGRGLYLMTLKNEPDDGSYDARFTALSYRTYVRNGFIVQNATARTASHGGIVVGAIQAATPTEPDIAVEVQGGAAVASGGTDALGTLTPGSSVTRTYTIENNGTSALTLGVVTVDAGLTITTDPSGQTVAAAGTAALAVSVDTATGGAFSRTVTVPSDDPDTGTYTWEVTGTVGLFTGGMTLASPPASLAMVATNTPPVYTGAVSLESQPASLAMAATNTPPVYTGVLAVESQPAVLAMVAATTPPVYTGALTLVAGAATLQMAATFEEVQTFAGVLTLASAPAVLSATVVFSETYTATVTLASAPAVLSFTATFSESAPAPGPGGDIWANRLETLRRVFWQRGSNMAQDPVRGLTLYITTGENKTFAIDFSKEGAVRERAVLSSPSVTIVRHPEQIESPVVPTVSAGPEVIPSGTVFSDSDGRKVYGGKGVRVRVDARGKTPGKYVLSCKVTATPAAGGDADLLEGGGVLLVE